MDEKFAPNRSRQKKAVCSRCMNLNQTLKRPTLPSHDRSLRSKWVVAPIPRRPDTELRNIRPNSLMQKKRLSPCSIRNNHRPGTFAPSYFAPSWPTRLQREILHLQTEDQASSQIERLPDPLPSINFGESRALEILVESQSSIRATASAPSGRPGD
jgi:hypothetical protein